MRLSFSLEIPCWTNGFRENPSTARPVWYFTAFFLTSREFLFLSRILLLFPSASPFLSRLLLASFLSYFVFHPLRASRLCFILYISLHLLFLPLPSFFYRLCILKDSLLDPSTCKFFPYKVIRPRGIKAKAGVCAFCAAVLFSSAFCKCLFNLPSLLRCIFFPLCSTIILLSPSFSEIALSFF